LKNNFKEFLQIILKLIWKLAKCTAFI